MTIMKVKKPDGTIVEIPCGFVFVGESDSGEYGNKIVAFQDGATITLANETEYRAEGAITSLALAFPGELQTNFISSLEFDTSESGNVDITFGEPRAYITGDACENGLFTPENGMHYSILFWYDGGRVQGVSRGVVL